MTHPDPQVSDSSHLVLHALEVVVEPAQVHRLHAQVRLGGHGVAELGQGLAQGEALQQAGKEKGVWERNGVCVWGGCREREV